MTEKRFIYCEEENGEFPFPYIKYDGKKVISLYECVDLLNQLADENEQLKQDKTNLHRAMSRDRVRYLNENEQLKEEIKDLNDVLARYEEKELEE